jgi:hypothetical protein
LYEQNESEVANREWESVDAEFEVVEATPLSRGGQFLGSAPCGNLYTDNGVERRSDSDQSRDAWRV